MIYVAAAMFFSAGFICALFLRSPTTDLDERPRRKAKVIDLVPTSTGSWRIS